MPLVRIDLRKGKDSEYRQRVGQVVYDAMRSVGVPENDRFQVIQEHDANGLVYDPDYLGIARTDDFISIRSPGTKAAIPNKSAPCTARSPTGCATPSVCARRTFSSTWLK